MAATTHGDYRGYLRGSADLEAGPQRLPPGHSEPSHRPLLFGTLVVMGLLQVASSVAILLHLTGYLQEVDLSAAPRQPIEEVQTEPVLNALRDTRRPKRRNCTCNCNCSKEVLPSAHLPIKARQENRKRGEPKAVRIDWDEDHGHHHRMGYEKGKLQVLEAGFYYVYSKTCFRYYRHVGADAAGPAGTPPADVSNSQLIQYVYHESIKQNSRAAILMKVGSTVRWNNTTYNMHCAQQGRGLRLERGDALFVSVSNAWMLDPDGEGTYFGAIKLGN